MHRLILRLTIALSVLVGSSTFVVAYAQQGNIPAPDPTCSPYGQTHLAGQHYETNGTTGPMGNLEPQYPIWCYSQPQAGLATRILNGSIWTDSWDNAGPAVQTLRDGDYNYRVFSVSNMADPNRFRVGTFINSDHWMLDAGRTPNRGDESTYRLAGGLLVSPDHTFPFVNGSFSTEVDAAAGSDAMGGADAFYEIDVSSASAPTGIQVDPSYGYGSFGRVGALGCRLEMAQDGGHIVCAMYDNTTKDSGGLDVTCAQHPCTTDGRPGRVWETQGVGVQRTASSVQGGYPDWPIPGTNLRVRDVWRVCADNEHDLHCRDRFRLELTKTSVHVLANGYPIMLIDGLYAVNPATGADNRIPDSWLSGGVRPYFTSWLNNWNATNPPVRWHWNDVNVNTATAGASISFCLGGTASATTPNVCAHSHVPGQPEVGGSTSGGTVTPLPVTATPVPATSTPVPTQTATASPTATATPQPTQTPVATSTPTPADVCSVFGLRNGVAESFPFPCPATPAFLALDGSSDAPSMASPD